MAPSAWIRTLLIGIAAGLALYLPPPAAEASLLRPLLALLRPQLENRLARACVQAAAGDNGELAARLEDPCRKLAVPTSKCLIEEADGSGRSIGVLSELVAGRFGDDSELVVKRCLARLFGLPPDSLRDMPLQDLARRFSSLSRPPREQP
ncbi:MAG: hypothetical protein VKJ44_06110 [Synechococcus sp.]|nr:hypothetical protein [Synechococcus sp.]